jgi:hypothetical protein
MTFAEAQREARTAFVGGSVGQVVTGAIWLLSAALGTWAGTSQGIIALFFGGMLIFPLTQLALRLLGKAGTLRPENPLGQYTLLSVFAMGAMYPLIYVAAVHNLNWFYPAFMLVVGAHYLSFVLLYGMRHYAFLGAALIGGGVALGVLLPGNFAAGGWLTGTALVVFGLFVWQSRAGQARRLRAQEEAPFPDSRASSDSASA